MNVVKTILKVLLTIIRIPFTVWYIATGWLVHFCRIGSKIILGKPEESDDMKKAEAILCFEWASLVKFYHLYW